MGIKFVVGTSDGAYGLCVMICFVLLLENPGFRRSINEDGGDNNADGDARLAKQ
jgi:hypothetical protein